MAQRIRFNIGQKSSLPVKLLSTFGMIRPPGVAFRVPIRSKTEGRICRNSLQHMILRHRLDLDKPADKLSRGRFRRGLPF